MIGYIRLFFTAVMLFSLAGLSWAGGLSVSKGFGEVPWGADISKRQGFMKLRSSDGVDYYVNMRENFDVRGFPNPTIFYGAAGGKLYAVHVRLTGPGDFQGLATSLKESLGQPKEGLDDQVQVLSWKFAGIRIKLKKLLSGEVRLSFYYAPMAAKLPARQRNTEPPNTADLLKDLPAGSTLLGHPGEDKPSPQRKQPIDLLDQLYKGTGTGIN